MFAKGQEFELGAEDYHLSKEMEVKTGTGLVQSLKIAFQNVLRAVTAYIS